jgi:nicotinic acid mononucleotide adenylyltransferase
MFADPFDLASMFFLREVIRSVDPDDAPALHTLQPTKPARSVAVLPGSFNPPTAAHLLLAERARSEGYEAVIFTLARTVVGKHHSGLIPEDRLLAMRAACGTKFGVGITSHGLYADQAEAIASQFPGADIAFLVGSDKVLQIFEDKWYPDREAALGRLFSRARLVVAPRGDQGERLRRVLSAPGNVGWSDRVEILQLHPAVSDMSSTRVRGLLRSGAEPNGLVPTEVAHLLHDMRAFAPPMIVESEEVDAYDVRARLIDLLWDSRGRDAHDTDLRTLVRIATAGGTPGRKLRDIIRNADESAGEELRAVAASA